MPGLPGTCPIDRLGEPGRVAPDAVHRNGLRGVLRPTAAEAVLLL